MTFKSPFYFVCIAGNSVCTQILHFVFNNLLFICTYYIVYFYLYFFVCYLLFCPNTALVSCVHVPTVLSDSSEIYVMTDPKDTPTEAYFELIGLLTHELSHQWFGNLATPVWWDYAWLKESLADYFEYFALLLVRKQRYTLCIRKTTWSRNVLRCKGWSPRTAWGSNKGRTYIKDVYRNLNLRLLFLPMLNYSKICDLSTLGEGYTSVLTHDFVTLIIHLYTL